MIFFKINLQVKLAYNLLFITAKPFKKEFLANYQYKTSFFDF